MRWIIYSITITVTPHERRGEWEHQPHRFFFRGISWQTTHTIHCQYRDATWVPWHYKSMAIWMLVPQLDRITTNGTSKIRIPVVDYLRHCNRNTRVLVMLIYTLVFHIWTHYSDVTMIVWSSRIGCLLNHLFRLILKKHRPRYRLFAMKIQRIPFRGPVTRRKSVWWRHHKKHRTLTNNQCSHYHI